MIRLTYSNRSERLLDALLERVAVERGRSLFEPIQLVVPNRNVETFLKLGIARATGIAANLKVRFLRRFVAEMVEESRPGVRIVDGSLHEGLLLDLLHDPRLLADDELAPVRAYLEAGDATGDVLDLRRYQLAHEMARLFDEYGFQRPDLLEAWRRGRSAVTQPEYREVERWQKKLWQKLFGAGGLAEKHGRASGVELRNLPALFRGLAPRELHLPPSVHVFGISYVARAYQEILHVVGGATELNLYTLNPCMEFWEDVQKTDSPDAEDPFRLQTPGDTLALRLWGRPGRENIRLLNELTDCNFVPAFEEPDAETVLGRLQRDILHREPENKDARRGPYINEDRSLAILACPGIRRELEVIAGEIWRLVKEDAPPPGGEPLRFNDIAVILPGAEQELYQTHLGSVFSETHDLPHNVVDLKLSSESRLVEAIELLLALPLGGFGRQDLLRLLTHPSVMSRFPEAAPDQWLGWCEALGIVHGGDREDHRGTYIDRDILNWDQGLKRLALGAFMTGKRSGDPRAVELAGGEYLPEEQPQGSLSSAAAFQLLARSLIEDTRFARTARLPLADWMRFLRASVSSYVGVAPGEDERVLLRCLAELSKLEALDLGGREVSYRIAYELATHALGSLPASRGEYLADGVVVSSFLPMRAIPFRVVFVAGLGEGKFPATDTRSHLDLRLAERRPGDVSPREQDKYMFLEALLCARERLYLSYVSRDPLTGDERAPSSVIVELEEVLRGYLQPDALERLKVRHPLRRHEDAQTRATCVAASREAQAGALGEHLRLAAGAPAPDLQRLARELPSAEWQALATQLGLPQAPDAAPVHDPGGVPTIAVSLSALRRFLECPLQGSARFLLGLREDDDEDLAAREHERFQTPRLDELMMLREVFVRAIGTDGASVDETRLATAYDRAAHRLQLRGEMPAGPFAAAERSGHVQVLAGWLAALRATAGPDAALRTFRFGRAEEHALVDTLGDPLVLPVALDDGRRRVNVELHGKTEAVVESVPGSLLLMQRKSGGEVEARNRKDALKGFLDHAVLTATGTLTAESYRVFIATGTDAAPHTTRFRPFTAPEARAWLTTLCGDLLSGVHSYLLPIEAVLTLHLANRKNKPTTLLRIVDTLRDNPRARYSSQYGPVARPERFEPPEEELGRAMIARRFGPFFERQVETGGEP